MNGRERVGGFVGSAKGIATKVFRSAVHGFEISRRQNHVAVKYYEPFARGLLRTIIACGGGTSVFLFKIGDVQTVLKACHDFLAGCLRAVFNYYDFYIGTRLSGNAFEQLANLGGAVVNGNNYGVLHNIYKNNDFRKSRGRKM